MLRDMAMPGLKEAQGCYGYLIEASADMPMPGLKEAQGLCDYFENGEHR